MTIEQLRQWLIFFRSHTGMLEMPIAAFGAAAALGTIWEVEVGLWAIAGLMYHYAGYGQNSFYDWNNGYDKDDPHKQHHPLNTGDIKPRHANIAANGAVILTIVYMVFIARQSLTAILLIGVAVVCGLLYNIVGKVFTHKYIFISIAHSLLFLIPYTVYANDIELFAILIFLALVVHHVFQIAISGDIKDIEQEESSVLNIIGISLNSTVDEFGNSIKVLDKTTTANIFIISISVLQIFLTVESAIVMGYLPDIYFGSIVGILGGLLISLSMFIVSSKEFIRSKRMKYISVRELVGFWMIYAALIPVIGINQYIVGFILCILYLIIHSRFMWGTIIRPKV